MIQLFDLIGTVLNLYSFALIIYILMSWFPGARESSIGNILTRICEPYLEQFRKFIPPLGMIDLSPLAGIIVINLAKMGLITLKGFFLTGSL